MRAKLLSIRAVLPPSGEGKVCSVPCHTTHTDAGRDLGVKGVVGTERRLGTGEGLGRKGRWRSFVVGFC